MGLIVKPVGVEEQKSVQETEEQLLRAQELKDAEAARAAEQKAEEERVAAAASSSDIDDEKILGYIGSKYGKSFKSIDDILSPQKEELPEDVSSFYKFKKETGRGIEDFMKLNMDVEKMNEDAAIREYLLETEEGIDPEDVDIMMKEYAYDEDLDDESDIERVKLKKKKILAKAKTYLSERREKYRVPLESRPANIPEEDLSEFENFKKTKTSKAETERAAQEKSKLFAQKTDEVFHPGFKGFEFDIDGKKIVFSPGDVNEVKNSQLSPTNFIAKYLDEKGFIKDANGYHKALAAAMNAERFARFFYEQGIAAAKDSSMKSLKNIQMSERTTGGVPPAEGLKARAIDDNHGNRLRVRKV